MAAQQHPLTVRVLAAVPAEERTTEMVLEKYGDYVATIAYRIMGRGEDLDDLLQDIFLETHRNLHTIKDWYSLRPWLTTVTVRAARRSLRLKRLARTFRPLSAKPAFEPIDPNTSADELLMFGRVYRVLDRLPANQRIAWILQMLQGESLQHIAEVCGCSVAAVKRRISKAQDAVERELGE
jgi:RNA polymerase sigma-70 factor (ECF subfamily)